MGQTVRWWLDFEASGITIFGVVGILAMATFGWWLFVASVTWTVRKITGVWPEER